MQKGNLGQTSEVEKGSGNMSELDLKVEKNKKKKKMLFLWKFVNR